MNRANQAVKGKTDDLKTYWYFPGRSHVPMALGRGGLIVPNALGSI